MNCRKSVLRKIGRTFDARIKHEQFNLIMSFFIEFPVSVFLCVCVCVLVICSGNENAVFYGVSHISVRIKAICCLSSKFICVFRHFFARKCQQMVLLFYLGELEPKLPAIHAHTHALVHTHTHIFILCGAIKMEIWWQLKRTKF